MNLKTMTRREFYDTVDAARRWKTAHTTPLPRYVSVLGQRVHLTHFGRWVGWRHYRHTHKQ